MPEYFEDIIWDHTYELLSTCLQPSTQRQLATDSHPHLVFDNLFRSQRASSPGQSELEEPQVIPDFSTGEHQCHESEIEGVPYIIPKDSGQIEIGRVDYPRRAGSEREISSVTNSKLEPADIIMWSGSSQSNAGRLSSNISTTLEPSVTPALHNAPLPQPNLKSGTVPGGYQLMTFDTDQGPIEVPVDVQAASKMADEKRKRDAGASTRFRQRWKEEEREYSLTISKLENQVREISSEKEYYRTKRDYFCNLYYERFPQSQPGLQSSNAIKSFGKAIAPHNTSHQQLSVILQHTYAYDALPSSYEISSTSLRTDRQENEVKTSGQAEEQSSKSLCASTLPQQKQQASSPSIHPFYWHSPTSQTSQLQSETESHSNRVETTKVLSEEQSSPTITSISQGEDAEARMRVRHRTKLGCLSMLSHLRLTA